ncbi:MAG: hypothetical protein E7294_07870 [Lachnospiraceae bacterium]|jgi:hypothetical protein|nr:hypothetical protein [Lachnospiraceae bacterium]
MERELRTANGSLYYESEKTEIVITGYHGIDAHLVIPEQIDGHPVTAIGKKAFLGQKNLMSIAFPPTLTYLEDWAFAHCYRLREVALYPVECGLGRGVFTECGRLEKARFLTLPAAVKQCSHEEADRLLNSISGLLMSTVTVLDAPYLFDPVDVGSREWLMKYDSRMETLLNRDDMEGYAKTISCGEEDYGNTSQEQYISEKHKSKVRLILARLLHDYGMADKMRSGCVEYLKGFMPPGVHTESWQVVREEYAENQECFRLLCDLGCVTEENIDILIKDLGQEHPERKGFLMKYKQERFAATDFFADFSL